MGAEEPAMQEQPFHETYGHDAPRVDSPRRVCYFGTSRTSLFLTWIYTQCRLVNDVDPQIQEQAFCLLRNLAEDEEGIALIVSSMGEDLVAGCIAAGLDSPSEPVTCEVRHP